MDIITITVILSEKISVYIINLSTDILRNLNQFIECCRILVRLDLVRMTYMLSKESLFSNLLILVLVLV